MTQNPYPIGTKLNLVPGASLWGPAHIEGRSGAIFEVVAQIDSPFGLPLIRVRDLDSGEIAFQGIDPHLFTPVDSTSGS